MTLYMNQKDMASHIDKSNADYTFRAPNDEILLKLESFT